MHRATRQKDVSAILACTWHAAAGIGAVRASVLPVSPAKRYRCPPVHEYCIPPVNEYCDFPVWGCCASPVKEHPTPPETYTSTCDLKWLTKLPGLLSRSTLPLASCLPPECCFKLVARSSTALATSIRCSTRVAIVSPLETYPSDLSLVICPLSVVTCSFDMKERSCPRNKDCLTSTGAARPRAEAAPRAPAAPWPPRTPALRLEQLERRAGSRVTRKRKERDSHETAEEEWPVTGMQLARPRSSPTRTALPISPKGAGLPLGRPDPKQR